MLQDKNIEWEKPENRKKALEVTDLFTKLENRVKRLAGLTVEEPEKKAVAQPAGLIK